MLFQLFMTRDVASRRMAHRTDDPPNRFSRVTGGAEWSTTWTRSLHMLFENALRPPDRLIGEIEPAVELAKLQFAALERRQGRGGG
jgi:hypothetical protein